MENNIQPRQVNLRLSNKQGKAWKALNDDLHTTIAYGGAAGGGKSYLGCFWIAFACMRYPGIRCVIGRKELKILKATTLQTLWQVFDSFGLKVDADYKYNEQSSEINFWNPETKRFDGSKIFLLDLRYEPSDPEFKRLGSYEVTFVFIDEANELVALAIDLINSRRRYKLKQYNLIPKTLLTFNPDKGFIKTQYYTPYRNGLLNAENKDNPEWEPLYELLVHEVFIPANVFDNPNIDPYYITNLQNLKDENTKQRLLFGNWEYDDKPGQLVLSAWFRDALRIPTNLSGKRRAAVDAAREGKDKTVVIIWNDNHIEEIHVVDIDAQIPNYSGRCADYLIPFFIQRGIGAKDVQVDGIGVGGGLIDAFAERHFYVATYKSSEKPLIIPGDKHLYKNRRAQSYWTFREDIQDGKITINPHLKYLDDLADDLYAHTWEEKSNQIVISPKEDVKLLLGRSPDFSDAAVMGYIPTNNNISYVFGESPFGEGLKSRIAFS